MFQKGNLFFADWRNRKGQRLRKSFSNSADALDYEQAQKAAAHPKAKRAAPPSPASSPRSSTKPRGTRAASQRRSSPKRAARERRRSNPTK